MNAMPATNLKLKYKEDNDMLAPVKKAKPAKIVALPVRKKAKRKGLSLRQQEELVLEYRLKARKLARSILRKWHSRLDLQEVDSIVDLSLCEAVRRYNPDKGASFMTFLFYHMRGNLIRAVSQAANSNLLPVGDGEAGESRLETIKGVNAMEVAEALNSNEQALPDDSLLRKEMAGLSQEACAKLDNLEREVIYRIYIQEQQLMDIASSLGYSRCHISRVKKKALETLFTELSSSMHRGDEDALREARKFKIEDLDEECGNERRKVHRRRPRSRKALQLQEIRAGEVVAA
ncbi:MAG: sigma-70 family RNA polymerase sigma factor [Oligoflexia bacterium]|nr:sigma-70 family RNA polymerase sigma factor [Oligoflexia bacterium]